VNENGPPPAAGPALDDYNRRLVEHRQRVIRHQAREDHRLRMLRHQQLALQQAEQYNAAIAARGVGAPGAPVVNPNAHQLARQQAQQQAAQQIAAENQAAQHARIRAQQATQQQRMRQQQEARRRAAPVINPIPLHVRLNEEARIRVAFAQQQLDEAKAAEALVNAAPVDPVDEALAVHVEDAYAAPIEEATVAPAVEARVIPLGIAPVIPPVGPQMDRRNPGNFLQVYGERPPVGPHRENYDRLLGILNKN
jgi:hypothetical protein